MKKHKRSEANSGFSLVEIAVVLVILSVLIAIVAMPLAAQIEQQRTTETNKQLETIKEALIGFAIASGRLPCPATTASNGAEAFVPVTGTAANGNCQQFVGFVPAATLGLSPVDSNGFALDAWGLQQNRIRYGVSSRTVTAGTPAACTTTVSNPILTSTNGMRNATMSCLADPALAALLTICSTTPTGAAGAATACSAALTNKAPFVLLSLGKNALSGGTGTDEAHNVDPTDFYFVSHTPTQAGSASGEFDDIVTWGSLNTLFARMVQAGKLP